MADETPTPPRMPPPTPPFRIKQFTFNHDKCAMKVGTDAILLGAWAEADAPKNILDIGTGSGVIALMLGDSVLRFRFNRPLNFGRSRKREDSIVVAYAMCCLRHRQTLDDGCWNSQRSRFAESWCFTKSCSKCHGMNIQTTTANLPGTFC